MHSRRTWILGGLLTAAFLAVAAGCDLRGAPDPDPPLLQSAYESDLRGVEHLLATGTPVDLRNENGETALFRAFQATFPRHDYRMLELLLAHGADICALDKNGESVLTRAVRSGDLPITLWLLDHKAADVYIRRGRTFRTTPLHIAAGLGHDNVVKLLIERGLDPSRHDESGLTPLDWALRAKRASTVTLLRGLEK